MQWAILLALGIMLLFVCPTLVYRFLTGPHDGSERIEIIEHR